MIKRKNIYESSVNLYNDPSRIGETHQSILDSEQLYDDEELLEKLLIYNEDGTNVVTRADYTYSNGHVLEVIEYDVTDAADKFANTDKIKSEAHYKEDSDEIEYIIYCDSTGAPEKRSDYEYAGGALSRILTYDATGWGWVNARSVDHHPDADLTSMDVIDSVGEESTYNSYRLEDGDYTSVDIYHYAGYPSGQIGYIESREAEGTYDGGVPGYGATVGDLLSRTEYSHDDFGTPLDESERIEYAFSYNSRGDAVTRSDYIYKEGSTEEILCVKEYNVEGLSGQDLYDSVDNPISEIFYGAYAKIDYAYYYDDDGIVASTTFYYYTGDGANYDVRAADVDGEAYHVEYTKTYDGEYVPPMDPPANKLSAETYYEKIGEDYREGTKKLFKKGNDGLYSTEVTKILVYKYTLSEAEDGDGDSETLDLTEEYLADDEGQWYKSTGQYLTDRGKKIFKAIDFTTDTTTYYYYSNDVDTLNPDAADIETYFGISSADLAGFLDADDDEATEPDDMDYSLAVRERTDGIKIKTLIVYKGDKGKEKLYKMVDSDGVETTFYYDGETNPTYTLRGAAAVYTLDIAKYDNNPEFGDMVLDADVDEYADDAGDKDFAITVDPTSPDAPTVTIYRGKEGEELIYEVRQYDRSTTRYIYDEDADEDYVLGEDEITLDVDLDGDGTLEEAEDANGDGRLNLTKTITRDSYITDMQYLGNKREIGYYRVNEDGDDGLAASLNANGILTGYVNEWNDIDYVVQKVITYLKSDNVGISGIAEGTIDGLFASGYNVTDPGFISGIEIAIGDTLHTTEARRAINLDGDLSYIESADGVITKYIFERDQQTGELIRTSEITEYDTNDDRVFDANLGEYRFVEEKEYYTSSDNPLWKGQVKEKRDRNGIKTYYDYVINTYGEVFLVTEYDMNLFGDGDGDYNGDPYKKYYYYHSGNDDPGSGEYRGELCSYVDANNKVKTYTYAFDANGSKTRMTEIETDPRYASDPETEIYFDMFGKITETISKHNLSIQYTYEYYSDGSVKGEKRHYAGTLVSQASINPITVDYYEYYRYDENGRAVVFVDKNGQYVTYDYVTDIFGNVVERTAHRYLRKKGDYYEKVGVDIVDNDLSNFTGLIDVLYDELLSTVEVFDPVLGVTTKVIDVYGREMEYSYEFDERGNMLARYETVTFWEYDEDGDGNVDSFVPRGTPDAVEKSYVAETEYYIDSAVGGHAVGDIKTTKDRNGIITDYTYTRDDNRDITSVVRQVTVPPGVDISGRDDITYTETYTYDPVTQEVISFEDKNGVVTDYSYTYDNEKLNKIQTVEDTLPFTDTFGNNIDLKKVSIMSTDLSTLGFVERVTLDKAGADNDKTVEYGYRLNKFGEKAEIIEIDADYPSDYTGMRPKKISYFNNMGYLAGEKTVKIKETEYGEGQQEIQSSYPLGTEILVSHFGLETAGDALWVAQNETAYDQGGFATETEVLGLGQSSYMRKTITVAVDTSLNFRWKVSSAGVDYLRLFDNDPTHTPGNEKMKISGSTGDWVDISYTLTAGTHNLDWVFSRSAGRPINNLYVPEEDIYALEFNGAGDYVHAVNFGDSLPSDITAITTEFWVKTDGTDEGLISYGPNNEWSIYNNSSGKLRIYRGGVCVDTGISINDGGWHHIAVTWESSTGTVTLYKDGASVYSGVMARDQSISRGHSLLIGGGFSQYPVFSGSMGPIGIYNEVIDSTEINDHANSLNIDLADPNLIAYYSFADGTPKDVSLATDPYDGFFVCGGEHKAWVDDIVVGTPSDVFYEEEGFYPGLPLTSGYTTEGDAIWTSQSAETFDEEGYAFQTGSIKAGQQTLMQTEITLTEASSISYFWKASDINLADSHFRLFKGTLATPLEEEILIQNQDFAVLANDGSWHGIETDVLEAGDYVFTWVYSRDPGTGTSRAGTIYIDEIRASNLYGQVYAEEVTNSVTYSYVTNSRGNVTKKITHYTQKDSRDVDIIETRYFNAIGDIYRMENAGLKQFVEYKYEKDDKGNVTDVYEELTKRYINDVTGGAGGANEYLDLDGASYVDAGDMPEMSGGHDLTVECKFEARDLSGFITPLVTKYFSADNKDWGLAIKNNRLFFGYERDGNNWDDAVGLEGTTLINTNAIYYAAFTYDHASRIVRIYLNGNLEGSITLPPAGSPDTQAPVEIGRDGGVNYFNGLIYDVAVYNRVLDDTEVLQYVSYGVTGNETGLVTYYSFDYVGRIRDDAMAPRNQQLDFFTMENDIDPTLHEQYAITTTSRKQFNIYGDITSLTDRNGKTSVYTYRKDADGDIISSTETDWQGNFTTRIYNKEGHLKHEIGKTGSITNYYYEKDEMGGIIGVTESDLIYLYKSPEETVYQSDPGLAPVEVMSSGNSYSYEQADEEETTLDRSLSKYTIGAWVKWGGSGDCRLKIDLLDINGNSFSSARTFYTENPDEVTGEYIYKSITLAPDVDVKSFQISLEMGSGSAIKNITVTKTPWVHGSDGTSNTSTSAINKDQSGTVITTPLGGSINVDISDYSMNELMSHPPTVVDKQGQKSHFTYEWNDQGQIVKSTEKKDSGDVIFRYYKDGLIYKLQKADLESEIASDDAEGDGLKNDLNMSEPIPSSWNLTDGYWSITDSSGSNQEIISQEIGIETGNNLTYLAFNHTIELNSELTRAHVKISNDNGATWTTIKTLRPSPAGDREIIDISDYEGQSVLVKFAWNSTSASDSWEISSLYIMEDTKGAGDFEKTASEDSVNGDRYWQTTSGTSAQMIFDQAVLLEAGDEEYQYYLSFRSKASLTTGEAKVEISYDGGTNWSEEIIYSAAEGDATDSWKLHFLDLKDRSNFAVPGDLKIRFAFNAGVEDWWKIDDIEITKSIQNTTHHGYVFDDHNNLREMVQYEEAEGKKDDDGQPRKGVTYIGFAGPDGEDYNYLYKPDYYKEGDNERNTKYAMKYTFHVPAGQLAWIDYQPEVLAGAAGDIENVTRKGAGGSITPITTYFDYKLDERGNVRFINKVTRTNLTDDLEWHGYWYNNYASEKYLAFEQLSTAQKTELLNTLSERDSGITTENDALRYIYRQIYEAMKADGDPWGLSSVNINSLIDEALDWRYYAGWYEEDTANQYDGSEVDAHYTGSEYKEAPDLAIDGIYDKDTPLTELFADADVRNTISISEILHPTKFSWLLRNASTSALKSNQELYDTEIGSMYGPDFERDASNSGVITWTNSGSQGRTEYEVLNTLYNGVLRYYRSGALDFNINGLTAGRTYDVKLLFMEPDPIGHRTLDEETGDPDVQLTRAFNINIESGETDPRTVSGFNIMATADTWHQYLCAMAAYYNAEPQYTLHPGVIQTFEDVLVSDGQLHVALGSSGVLSGIEVYDSVTGECVKRVNIGGERYSPEGSIYISQQMAESMFVENRLYTNWTDEYPATPATQRIDYLGYPHHDLGNWDDGVVITSGAGTSGDPYVFDIPNGVLLKHGLIETIDGATPIFLQPINRPESKAQYDMPAWDTFVGTISNRPATGPGSTEWAILPLLPLPPPTYDPPVDITGLDYAENIAAYKEELKPHVERMLEIIFWQNLGRNIWRDDRTGPSELEYFTDLYLNNDDYDMDVIEKWLTGEAIPADQAGPYNNDEYGRSDTFRTNVITDVKTYLNHYATNGLTVTLDTYTFSGLFDYLDVQSIDTVTLTPQDINDIEAYLNSTDLHFGRSAYDSLVALLGLNPTHDLLDADRQEIAKAVIIIEILLGLLNPNAPQGMGLIISMYSLALIAGACKGADFNGYDLLRDSDFETAMAQLKDIIDNLTSTSEGVIVYTEKGHFMTVTAIDDLGDPAHPENWIVTIVDHGEERTLTGDEFKEIWSGRIICEQQAVINAGLLDQLENNKLSIAEMQRTKGGCIGGLVALFIGLASAVATAVAIVAAVVIAVATFVVQVVCFIYQVIGSVLTLIGDAISFIGTTMMDIGSGLMGVGEGWMGTGVGLMGNGTLGGFIVGSAMVVAGAAVYAVGAIVWAAGAVVNAIGEVISQTGTELSEGAKSFSETGFKTLTDNLFSLESWGFTEQGFVFENFMSNLALTARVYNAVDRTVNFVKDVKEYGWGTAFKNLGIRIAASIVVNMAYNYVAQNILPGILPLPAEFTRDGEPMGFSQGILHELTLGWSSVGQSVGDIITLGIGRMALPQSTDIVANVVAGEVVDRVLDEDASPWARFGLRAGTSIAIRWGSMSFGGYEYTEETSPGSGVWEMKGERDYVAGEYNQMILDELTSAAFTEWSRQASVSIAKKVEDQWLSEFLSELARVGIRTIGSGYTMGWTDEQGNTHEGLVDYLGLRPDLSKAEWTAQYGEWKSKDEKGNEVVHQFGKYGTSKAGTLLSVTVSNKAGKKIQEIIYSGRVDEKNRPIASTMTVFEYQKDDTVITRVFTLSDEFDAEGRQIARSLTVYEKPIKGSQTVWTYTNLKLTGKREYADIPWSYEDSWTLLTEQVEIDGVLVTTERYEYAKDDEGNYLASLSPNEDGSNAPIAIRMEIIAYEIDPKTGEAYYINPETKQVSSTPYKRIWTRKDEYDQWDIWDGRDTYLSGILIDGKTGEEYRISQTIERDKGEDRFIEYRKLGKGEAGEFNVTIEGQIMQWNADGAFADGKLFVAPTAEDLENGRYYGTMWEVDANRNLLRQFVRGPYDIKGEYIGGTLFDEAARITALKALNFLKDEGLDPDRAELLTDIISNPGDDKYKNYSAYIDSEGRVHISSKATYIDKDGARRPVSSLSILPVEFTTETGRQQTEYGWIGTGRFKVGVGGDGGMHGTFLNSGRILRFNNGQRHMLIEYVEGAERPFTRFDSQGRPTYQETRDENINYTYLGDNRVSIQTYEKDKYLLREGTYKISIIDGKEVFARDGGEKIHNLGNEWAEVEPGLYLKPGTIMKYVAITDGEGKTKWSLMPSVGAEIRMETCPGRVSISRVSDTRLKVERPITQGNYFGGTARLITGLDYMTAAASSGEATIYEQKIFMPYLDENGEEKVELAFHGERRGNGWYIYNLDTKWDSLEREADLKRLEALYEQLAGLGTTVDQWYEQMVEQALSNVDVDTDTTATADSEDYYNFEDYIIPYPSLDNDPSAPPDDLSPVIDLYESINNTDNTYNFNFNVVVDPERTELQGQIAEIETRLAEQKIGGWYIEEGHIDQFGNSARWIQAYDTLGDSIGEGRFLASMAGDSELAKEVMLVFMGLPANIKPPVFDAGSTSNYYTTKDGVLVVEINGTAVRDVFTSDENGGLKFNYRVLTGAEGSVRIRSYVVNEGMGIRTIEGTRTRRVNFDGEGTDKTMTRNLDGSWKYTRYDFKNKDFVISFPDKDGITCATRWGYIPTLDGKDSWFPTPYEDLTGTGLLSGVFVDGRKMTLSTWDPGFVKFSMVNTDNWLRRKVYGASSAWVGLFQKAGGWLGEKAVDIGANFLGILASLSGTSDAVYDYLGQKTGLGIFDTFSNISGTVSGWMDRGYSSVKYVSNAIEDWGGTGWETIKNVWAVDPWAAGIGVGIPVTLATIGTAGAILSAAPGLGVKGAVTKILDVTFRTYFALDAAEEFSEGNWTSGLYSLAAASVGLKVPNLSAMNRALLATLKLGSGAFLTAINVRDIAKEGPSVMNIMGLSVGLLTALSPAGNLLAARSKDVALTGRVGTWLADKSRYIPAALAGGLATYQTSAMIYDRITTGKWDTSYLPSIAFSAGLALLTGFGAYKGNAYYTAHSGLEGSPATLNTIWQNLAGGVVQGAFISPTLYAGSKIGMKPLMDVLVRNGIINPVYEDINTGHLYSIHGGNGTKKLSEVSSGEFNELKLEPKSLMADTYETVRTLAQGNIEQLGHTMVWGGMFGLMAQNLGAFMERTTATLKGTGHGFTSNILGGANKAYNYTMGGAFGGEGLTAHLLSSGQTAAAGIARMAAGIFDEALIEPVAGRFWQALGVRNKALLEQLQELCSSGVDVGYISSHVSMKALGNFAVNENELTSEGIMVGGKIASETLLYDYFVNKGIDGNTALEVTSDEMLISRFENICNDGVVDITQLSAESFNELLSNEVIANGLMQSQTNIGILRNKVDRLGDTIGIEAKYMLNSVLDAAENADIGQRFSLAVGLMYQGREAAEAGSGNVITKWIEGRESTINAADRFNVYNQFNRAVNELAESGAISDSLRNELIDEVQDNLLFAAADYANDLAEMSEGYAQPNVAPPISLMQNASLILDGISDISGKQADSIRSAIAGITNEGALKLTKPLILQDVAAEARAKAIISFVGVIENLTSEDRAIKSNLVNAIENLAKGLDISELTQNAKDKIGQRQALANAVAHLNLAENVEAGKLLIALTEEVDIVPNLDASVNENTKPFVVDLFSSLTSAEIAAPTETVTVNRNGSVITTTTDADGVRTEVTKYPEGLTIETMTVVTYLDGSRTEMREFADGLVNVEKIDTEGNRTTVTSNEAAQIQSAASETTDSITGLNIQRTENPDGLTQSITFTDAQGNEVVRFDVAAGKTASFVLRQNADSTNSINIAQVEIGSTRNDISVRTVTLEKNAQGRYVMTANNPGQTIDGLWQAQNGWVFKSLCRNNPVPAGYEESISVTNTGIVVGGQTVTIDQSNDYTEYSVDGSADPALRNFIDRLNVITRLFEVSYSDTQHGGAFDFMLRIDPNINQAQEFLEFIFAPQGNEYLTGAGKSSVLVHVAGIVGLMRGRARSVGLFTTDKNIEEACPEGGLIEALYNRLGLNVQKIKENDINGNAEATLTRVEGADVIFSTYSVCGFNSDIQSYAADSAEAVIHAFLTHDVMLFGDEIHTIHGQNFIKTIGENRKIQQAVKVAVRRVSQNLIEGADDLRALIYAGLHEIKIADAANAMAELNGKGHARETVLGEINEDNGYIKTDSSGNITFINLARLTRNEVMGKRISPVFNYQVFQVLASKMSGVDWKQLKGADEQGNKVSTSGTPELAVVRAVMFELAKLTRQANNSDYGIEGDIIGDPANAMVVPRDNGKNAPQKRFSNEVEAAVKQFFGLAREGIASPNLDIITVSDKSTQATLYEFMTELLENGSDVIPVTGTFSLVTSMMKALGVKVDRSASIAAMLRYTGQKYANKTYDELTPAERNMVDKLCTLLGVTYEDIKNGADPAGDGMRFDQHAIMRGLGQTLAGVEQEITDMISDGLHRVVTVAGRSFSFPELTNIIKTKINSSGTTIDLIFHNDQTGKWEKWEYQSGSLTLVNPDMNWDTDVQGYLKRNDVNQTLILTHPGDKFGLDLQVADGADFVSGALDTEFVDILDTEG
jgi:hypothetical protein